MDHHAASTNWSADRPSRFEFAPPRNFLLPVILLLLSDQAGYGYQLVKELQNLRFGQVDRPSVYRALAQLEFDGLVRSRSETAKGGRARRVYELTEHGERVLRAWMGVIKEERDCLDRVLQRYQASPTIDAALAGVEWGLGQPWSPVSSTFPTLRRSTDGAAVWRMAGNGPSPEDLACDEGDLGGRFPSSLAPSDEVGCSRCRFRVLPDRSVLLIEARSTVGPISFGTIGLTGYVEAAVRNGTILTDTPPAARLESPVAGLHSGNNLYDAELLRRIDARRFPTASIDLRRCTAIGGDNRYRLAGEVTFHGVTRPVQGTVTVSVGPHHRLQVTGEQVLDIRDFEIASPTVLMLRIYPDVRVHLHVEAELVSGS